MSGACLNMGKVHFHQGNLEQSLVMLRRSIDIATEIGDKKHEKYCCEYLAKIFESQRDFESTVRYFKRFHELTTTMADKHRARPQQIIDILIVAAIENS